MPISENKIRFNVTMERENLKSLDDVCKKAGLSRSQIINMLMKLYLNDILEKLCKK